jgi:catechol 2,3-dioxygenase-like lactoylglutathione lyase family enzyme
MKTLTALVVWATAVSLSIVGSEPTKRPPLVGIDHVVFRTSDAIGASAFYGELLGLARARAGLVPGILEFTVNARQRVLVEPGLPAGTDERLDHIAFATSDLGALGVYLRERGVKVDGPAEYSPCLRPALRVKDPEGHLIEFVQEAGVVAATFPPPDRALSSRLLHAGVTVHDEASANGFYHDVLGMDEIWRGGSEPSKTSWVNMRVPDGSDYLEYMLRDAPSSRRQLGVDHHICLRVADIQAAWELVRQRTPAERRATLEAPRIGRNQKWQLNLYDPDGTRVELMEPFNVK